MDNQFCNPEVWGGIECTINRVRNEYFDQLTYSGHYDRPEDIDRLAELNIKKIRYPILWEKHQPEKDSIPDWTWISGQLEKIRSHKIEVIAGLVHHGSGPAFTRLTDRKFPAYCRTMPGRWRNSSPGSIITHR
jgi:dTDP-4-dehydrorhamnose reductase